jgi:hypothetical protein
LAAVAVFAVFAVAAVLVSVLLASGAVSVLLIIASLPPQAARSSTLAAKAASDGRLVLSEECFKTAPTLQHRFY